MPELEKKNWIILELVQNNTTHILSEFTWNNTDIFEVTSKQYYPQFPEFISNNIDTSRVTTKQYYKIIFYVFIKRNWHILQTFSTEDIPDNTSFPLRCELILNLYWLGYWNIFFLLWLQPFSKKSLINHKWTLPGLSMSCPGPLYVTV